MSLEPTRPALYEHCQVIYSAMDKSSTVEGEHKVWTGFATHLFKDHNLSVPYYTQVMRMLRAMECLKQVRRGGGTAESKWLLFQEPSMELFDKASTIPGARLGGNKSAQTDQMIRDLNTRLLALEDRFEHA